ncbi:MAG: ABC transporter ATP-binding protein [Bacteroidota bacterium]|nr:ABC transporter ATP-binding protein/permease [Candidatus Kapabacteria bacterium]MDW8219624.1 ABC transporter ATP-binding protein [Bacteroidota bacterium]
MKELLRLKPYFVRYKWMFVLGFIFVTISNICSTSLPRVVGATIDAITGSRAVQALSTHDIALHIGLMFALTAGSGFFMFLTRKTIIVASRKIEYELRADVVQALSRLSLGYFQRTPTGELMAYSTNDIAAVREFIGPAVMYSANTLTTFIFALSMMITLSPSITVAALLPMPLVSYGVYRIGARVHVLFKAAQDHYAKMTTQAQENLSGVRVIRAYGCEEYEILAFASMAEDYRNRMMSLVRIEASMMPLMMSLIGLSQVLVLGVGGYLVMHGQATIGDVTQFFIYLNQLIWPVIAIGWVTNLVQRAAASARRLGRVFDEVPEITDSEETDSTITELRGDIEFRNVRMRYANNLPFVLGSEDCGISFRVAAGQCVGIVGETGSGKSTLVHLIPRLFDVTHGEILIDGVPLRRIPLRVLRSNIALVPQESFLFSMTIADNIRFGKPSASVDEIIQASVIAQLHENVEHFPQGYTTLVGERGITLSGGQKQRTAIARAILCQPRILIFDDALSAVDTETEEKILHALKRVMASRTSIIIAHRISTVKHADVILVLSNGMIIEHGTHEELLAHGGVYADMYSRQLLEEEISLLE